MHISEVEIPSGSTQELTATVCGDPNDATRIVVALHGAILGANFICNSLLAANEDFLLEHKFALICPEAKSLQPLSGGIPRYEAPPLDKLVPSTVDFIRGTWPGLDVYLAGHSYGGRGVILQGLQMEFRAYGMIAPYAQSLVPGEFEDMLAALKSTDRPYHLAFSQDDPVAFVSEGNAERLLRLGKLPDRVVTNYRIPLIEDPHNTIIQRQSRKMFEFFLAH